MLDDSRVPKNSRCRRLCSQSFRKLCFNFVAWAYFLPFLLFAPKPDFHLLISPSQDGDLLARLAQLMGYSVIRGSTFKKAISSARSLVKVLRRGERIIIIADGSRGPRIKAQAGSIQIAGITASPLIPMTYGARHKIELSTWDRFVLPFPFTHCSVSFGKRISVPHRPDIKVIQEKQEELEKALDHLHKENE